jgi:hypothetical protein
VIQTLFIWRVKLQSMSECSYSDMYTSCVLWVVPLCTFWNILYLYIKKRVKYSIGTWVLSVFKFSTWVFICIIGGTWIRSKIPFATSVRFSFVSWQEKKNYGFWPLGVAEPPPMALPPPRAKTHQNFFWGFAYGGGSATPKGQNPSIFFF